MSYFPGSDYNIQVRLGNVPGFAAVAIQGHNEDLTTNKITLAPGLTTEILTQSDLDTTAATVQVASTSANDVNTTGTGLRTLAIIGLDAAGAAQTETVTTLNGQTAVATTATFSAVYGIRGLTAGTTGSNEGVIWVGNGTFAAGVPPTPYISTDIGFNKSLTGYYVVPAAKTFYGIQFIASLAAANKDVELFIETSADGVFWVTEAVFGVVQGDNIYGPILAMTGLVAGTHIRIQAEASAAGSDITVILDGYLVDD